METVEALERAVKRITTEEDEGNNKNENPTIFKFLRWLKGINLADRNVADTLSVHYKITLTDDELLAFTKYLILTDPTYPRWSETKFIKDHSNVNEAGNPSQVYVYDNSKRFHDAYLNFKKSNKKSKVEIP